MSWKQIIVESTLTLVGCFLIFGLGYIVGQSTWGPVSLVGPAETTPPEVREDFVAFWEIWERINTAYYDQPVDRQMLIEGAMRGMVESLEDRNSAYMSPDEQEIAQATMEGEFQGIGAEVTANEDEQLVIVSPYPGSPAEEAGLRPRDILLQADDTELTGLDVRDAAAVVRGPAGTDVTLLVERDEERFQVIVTRGVITIPSVIGEMITEGDQKIAHVRLTRFGENSGQELVEELERLLGQNPAGLVFDLRRNPGGALVTAVDVADQFLAEDNLVLIEEFSGNQTVEYETSDEGVAEEIPLVVLVDEGSASASEVIAGAIRDAERGILIGETTFGKGTVQSWAPLSNGGGLRITVARWLTPAGIWVHEEGLTPDIVVSLSDEVVQPADFVDAQLDAAVDYLLGEEVRP